MPAEKLTKHKLAQILIVLTLLSIAFIWGTVKRDTRINAMCAYAKKCYFRVNDAEVGLIPTSSESGMNYTIMPVKKGWYLSNNNRVYAENNNKIAAKIAQNDQPVLYTTHGQSVDFSFKN